MNILPNHYLLTSIVLFALGLLILATRQERWLKMMGFYLMFQAVLLSLVALTEWFQVWEGQIALLVLWLTATMELIIQLRWPRY